MKSHAFRIRKSIEISCMLAISAALTAAGCAATQAAENTTASQASLPPAVPAMVRTHHPAVEVPEIQPAQPVGEVVVSNSSGPPRPRTRSAGRVISPVKNGEDLPQRPQPSLRLIGTASATTTAPIAPLPTSWPRSKSSEAQTPVAPKPTARTVVRANSATFDQQVLQSDVPVLVDFFADWCGPCRAIAPTLEELAAESPYRKVVKVNIDDSPELAAQYGVSSIPTLIVFKDGRVVARQEGVVSKARMKTLLEL